MHSPQSATNDRQPAAIGQSAPTFHQFHAVFEGELARATIETRTDREEALARGAAIMDWLDGSEVWSAFDSPSTCIAIVQRMCFRFGRVESWSKGLIVRCTAKELAAAAGLTERSIYKPMRAMIAEGLLIRFGVSGNRPCAYELRSRDDGADSPTERAPQSALHPQSALAAQCARATDAAASVGDSGDACNLRTNNELARAVGAARSVGAGGCAADAGFSTGNALAAPTERAGPDSTVRIRTDTFTSTQENSGTGGRGESIKGLGSVEWLLPWLLSLPAMNPKVARKLAVNPLITPKLALAARYELENSAAASKPDFKPAGLIFRILTNPQRQISERAWEYADSILGSAPDRPPAFAGTRLADLFVQPAGSMLPPAVSTPNLPIPSPSPAANPLGAVGGSIVQRATQIQQTISDGELAGLHRQLINAAPNEFTRAAWAKSNPRTSPAIHALIVRRLSGGQPATGNQQLATNSA